MNNNRHIHIIGICGVATSAIAIAFKKAGYIVTGSDKGFFPPISDELEKHGISFYAGWHPEQMGNPDIVMTGGSGTSPNNPETVYAKERGISVYDYPQLIQKYFIKENSIVVVGTWGKTTISSLLSFILLDNNMNPSYFTGGLSLSHDSGAISDSKWSIVEGDEYQVSISDKRPKFVYYSPTHLLLTSVSWDHADLYPTEEIYFDTFKKLISDIPEHGTIVANIDNDGVKKIVDKAITYGKSNADYVYSNVEQNENGLKFEITSEGRIYNITSKLLGVFQAENITGAFAMAKSIGLDPKQIINSISKFQGMKRRLEKRFDGDIKVFDDIAHSGEKANAVLKNLRSIYKGKIVAIFEPNIGGRERNSKKLYDNAFNSADYVIIPRLTKLKIDSGKDTQPIDGNELANFISNTNKNTVCIEDDSELVKSILNKTNKGDIIVFLGSHGFRGMIEEVISKLK